MALLYAFCTPTRLSAAGTLFFTHPLENLLSKVFMGC